MATTIKLLQYVENTAGNATLSNFMEDWEPIGRMAWDDLLSKGYVEINKAGMCALTELGKTTLADMKRLDYVMRF